MTVVKVWGLIAGGSEEPLAQQGDEWYFPIPPGLTRRYVICEFWAEDEAGNIGYRSAILELQDGGVKCIRWIPSSIGCRMAPPLREISMEEGRPQVKIDCGREIEMNQDRPKIKMALIKCPMGMA